MADLKDLYAEELQDMISANDQMERIVGEMARAAEDDKLRGRLEKAGRGIGQHTAMLKGLAKEAGASGSEHCKGMEGLVAEARKHALEGGHEGAVRDVAIIAQYQRMCHYGMAGFGTAKAYADALGMGEAARKLEEALDSIYDSDEFMSDLAERSKNLQAA